MNYLDTYIEGREYMSITLTLTFVSDADNLTLNFINQNCHD